MQSAKYRLTWMFIIFMTYSFDLSIANSAKRKPANTSEGASADFSDFEDSSVDTENKQKPTLSMRLVSILQTGRWLEARSWIKSIQLKDLNLKDWTDIRNVLHRYPQIGWDVIKYWDQEWNKSLNPEDLQLQEADRNMLAENFYSAYVTYQKLAVKILNQPTSLRARNMKLYWTLLHSMGRAAYGAKNFDLAYQLYQKIPSTYELFRQVQFEKMWSAYRADKIDLAIGAVGSQASAYFSSFFEPETYLLQFYIFKRMCRTYEINNIKSKVYDLKKKITQKNIKDSDWLAKDIETLIYKQILMSSKTSSLEKTNLLSFIKQRKQFDMQRMEEQLSDVISFIEILQRNKKALAPIVNRFKIESVIHSKLEKWNVEDTEEWLDDLGKHVFIGQSECTQ